MKKLICLLTIVIVNHAFAQTGKDVYAFNTSKLNHNLLLAFDHATASSEKSINAKTLINFSKNFKNAVAAQWFTTANNEAMCRFFQKGILTMAYYKTNGTLFATVKKYNASELPQHVTEMVTDAYADSKITLAEEINISGQEKTYVVHIERGNSIKLLRIVADEIEVIKDLKN
jgi:hypothetical protein